MSRGYGFLAGLLYATVIAFPQICLCQITPLEPKTKTAYRRWIDLGHVPKRKLSTRHLAAALKWVRTRNRELATRGIGPRAKSWRLKK